MLLSYLSNLSRSDVSLCKTENICLKQAFVFENVYNMFIQWIDVQKN